jgi:D-aminopeptidase
MSSKKKPLKKKKKVERKISQGVQKSLAQRHPVEPQNNPLDTVENSEFSIQHDAIVEAYNKTQLPTLISKGIIPSFSSMNSLNMENEIDSIFTTIKNNNQSKHIHLPLLRFYI